MNVLLPTPDGTAVIEVDARTTVCVMEGCGGAVLRHSLGAGQAIQRCTRCFRRYQVRADRLSTEQRSKLRRIVDDFLAWRE